MRVFEGGGGGDIFRHLPESDKGDDVKVEVTSSLLPSEFLDGLAEITQGSCIVEEDRLCDGALLCQRRMLRVHG